MNFINNGYTSNELTQTEKLSQAVDLMCEKYSILEIEKNKYKEQVEKTINVIDQSEYNEKFNYFMSMVELLLDKYKLDRDELLKFKKKDLEYKNPLLTEEIFKEMTDEISKYITKVDNLEKENKTVLELKNKIKELEENFENITSNYEKEHKERKELEQKNKDLIWENDCLSTDYGFDNDFEGFSLDENGIKQLELEKKGRIFNCLDLNNDSYYDVIDSVDKARDFLFLDDIIDKKILKLVYRGLSQYFHPDIAAHRGDAKLGEEIFKKITDSNELLKKVSY